ncbi:MAG: DNA polymerase, partial [Candidatus Hodarchaeales archaeon]
MSYRLKITKEEAEAFIKRYFEGFPKLEENIERIKDFVNKNGYVDTWFGIERIKDFVNKNGYVDTWFGFRRHWQYYGVKEHKTQREAVNHPIQGTAWNIMEKILIDVDKLLSDYQSKLVWQNYDSLTVEAKEEEIDELAPKIQDIMESVQKPYDVL